MRTITEEKLYKERIKLRSLQDDWEHLNKRYLDAGLRESLQARICEQRVSINRMEAQLKKSDKSYNSSTKTPQK
jgi:hypothetical protein